jgi:SAM-dependent methyltransferase
MQNVGMNIADKRKLYEEVYRVLKPDGRFAFQEMTAGQTATSYFPLPWASDPADHFLISAEEMYSVLGESGFTAEYFEDVSDSQLTPSTSGTHKAAAQIQLSLSVYVDNLAQKGENAVSALIPAFFPITPTSALGDSRATRLRSSRRCRLRQCA